MVSSNNEPKESNGYYSSDYSYITEGLLFAGVVGYDVGDYTKSWENKNVNLGVAKESEEVLVKDGISSPCRVKEGGV